MKTILVLGLVFATGCGKDEDESKNNGNNLGNNSEKIVSDPEGTITIAVRNYDGKTWTSVRPDGCDNDAIGIGMDNNFFGYSRDYWDFATFGKVSGLGNVNKIPTSGWANAVAVTLGTGYVARYQGGNKTTYVRIYVIDYILSATSGGVIGANIKYQSPFEP